MSSTAIQTRPVSAVAEASGFSQDQVELIKKQIMPGASNDDLKLFCHVAHKTGLDPMARQIYAVQRGGKWAYQTSIDGYRLIAQRTGEYEGQTKPEWCGEDGKWVELWTKKEPPFAARVGVYRKGFREPVYGVARFDAYCQTVQGGRLNQMWSKMGDLMISKCAESLAFRKAFPQELAAVYTQEEMGQADSPRDPEPEYEENSKWIPHHPFKNKTCEEVGEAALVDYVKRMKAGGSGITANQAENVAFIQKWLDGRQDMIKPETVTVQSTAAPAPAEASSEFDTFESGDMFSQKAPVRTRQEIATDIFVERKRLMMPKEEFLQFVGEKTGKDTADLTDDEMETILQLMKRVKA